MKDIIFALLAAGLFLLPAGEHDAFNQIDPDPTDTIEMPIDTLRCEDTIEMNYPGTMENGYIKAINTCRDWKASGKAKISSASAEHYFIDGNTFYPFILTTGDTAFFKAEGIGFYVPTKVEMCIRDSFYPGGSFPLYHRSGSALCRSWALRETKYSSQLDFC